MLSLLSLNFTDSNVIRATVEKANTSAPGFARIFGEMVIITSPDRPLPRAPKGTVVRKEALFLYSEKINEL
jgi:hypothetical protein